jgi:hypothetical protein
MAESWMRLIKPPQPTDLFDPAEPHATHELRPTTGR